MNKQLDEIMQLVSEYAITCLTYARTQDEDDFERNHPLVISTAHNEIDYIVRSIDSV